MTGSRRRSAHVHPSEARRRSTPRHRSFLALGLLLVAGFAAPSTAQVPTAVPYQGLLLDSAGAPVTDAVELSFELFDALQAGASLWSESISGVSVVDGVYAVRLGETTPLTAAVLANGPVFLEITVDGETLVPRQQLLSVPFALVSQTSV